MLPGSLIFIKKNVRDIVIPSEERKLNMYPMDYEEFLWATDDTVYLPAIDEQFVPEKLDRSGFYHYYFCHFII
ncbi:hypothetical protein BXO88_09020 [Oribacterium sp. C9]|nr:hypothetical protein BXO88_09020 [Oribacterium sp. C9]